jgi:hypothetical protein
MSANQELIPAEDAKRLVTRFLIELIGYNLSANMEELAHAMSSASPDTSPFSSTPSVEETDELHKLASLTTLLHEKVDTNDINSVSKTERQLLFRKIIQPAEALNVSGAFALSLIGEYTAHNAPPQNRRRHISDGRRLYGPLSGFSDSQPRMSCSHSLKIFSTYRPMKGCNSCSEPRYANTKSVCSCRGR